MASPMNPPESAGDFLASCGWAGARIEPLAGDASFRRYFRVLRDDGHQAVLMDAPPPHEDPRPFISVAEWLVSVGLSAPEILSRDLERGLLVLRVARPGREVDRSGVEADERADELDEVVLMRRDPVVHRRRGEKDSVQVQMSLRAPLGRGQVG